MTKEIVVGPTEYQSEDSLLNKGMRRAIEAGARTYVQTRDWPQDVKDFFSGEILPSSLKGEKRSLARDSHRLLRDCKVEVYNCENIPQRGPVVFLANHWSESSLDGLRPHIAINREVGLRRLDDQKDVQWVMNGRAFKRAYGLPIPFSDRVVNKIGDAYSMHLVRDAKGIGAGVKIIREFQRGRLVGLNPEANWSTNLQEGHPNAGSIVSLLANAKPEGKICPVGVYTDPRGTLFVQFGEPFGMKEILERSYPMPRDKEQRRAVNARTANFMMQKINPLVHPKYRLAEILQ